MAFSLLSHIKIGDERDEALEFIDLLLTSLYQKKEESFDSLLDSRIPIHYAKAIRDDLAENKDSVETYCKNIKKAITEMEQITLTIAFLPSYSSIEMFASYIKREYGTNCVLDIRYDPSLIAGATISYKGTYKDFSVREQFLKTIENMREAQTKAR